LARHPGGAWRRFAAWLAEEREALLLIMWVVVGSGDMDGEEEQGDVMRML
jgi:hypothetical protein